MLKGDFNGIKFSVSQWTSLKSSFVEIEKYVKDKCVYEKKIYPRVGMAGELHRCVFGQDRSDRGSEKFQR